MHARLERLAREEPAALDDGSLYDRIIGEVERPLIEALLARHGQNQLRARARARHQPQYAAQTARYPGHRS